MVGVLSDVMRPELGSTEKRPLPLLTEYMTVPPLGETALTCPIKAPGVQLVTLN